jgi:deoxyribodipyrimidine photo-lyase
MPGTARLLPTPPSGDGPDALAWVVDELADLVAVSQLPVRASDRFRGGQQAADTALAATDLTGYAARRGEVWPVGRRGATGLSPYVRHGLLDLPTLWAHAAGAPAVDRDRFRDELLWQEYARHLTARLGTRTGTGLRQLTPTATRVSAPGTDPWAAARRQGMVCVTSALDELTEDGWMTNATRMWLASHWAVRAGVRWEDGEDLLFRQLLDGSRAANRLGWQWVAGTATGRPYGFSRSQVERRAPGMCATCPLQGACPIEDWPADPVLLPAGREELLRTDPDPERTAGPDVPVSGGAAGAAEAVWLTAESLGDADPALRAHPDLPAVFVFDVPLLRRLRLAPARLVFLAESLGDLAQRRTVEVWRGDPRDVLGRSGPSRPLAVTFTPVPGWRTRVRDLPVATVHPWRWLVRPAAGPLTSFSAWRGRSRRG